MLSFVLQVFSHSIFFDGIDTIKDKTAIFFSFVRETSSSRGKYFHSIVLNSFEMIKRKIWHWYILLFFFFGTHLLRKSLVLAANILIQYTSVVLYRKDKISKLSFILLPFVGELYNQGN